MTTNTLLHPLDELHFEAYKPADVAAALDATEVLVWERLNHVLELPVDQRTFQNTVLGISRADLEFSHVTGLVGHLQSVLGEPWREAEELMTERYSALSNKVLYHRGLYDVLVEVRNNQSIWDSLNAQEQKLLTDMILDRERLGIALSEVLQTELKDLRTQLSQQSMHFSQNSVNASDAAGLTLASDDQLAGVSQDFLENARKAAVERDQAGYYLAYSQPNYIHVMTTCSVRDTREQLYNLHIGLAAETNGPVAYKTLKLRRRFAEILGYQDYADYVLEERMAGSGAVAMNFIDDLAERYRPVMTREVAELQDFARELEANPALELTAADVHTGTDFYYAARRQAQTVGIDTSELKAYFELTNVLAEMFDTLSTLYGVSFKRIELPTWHKDVQVYEIYDGTKHLSTVWCDWYARTGKQSGAWANELYTADRAGGKFDRPHLGLVVANFESPNDAGQSRLTLRDVETIWHEFGHFMHFTLGTTELIEQSMFASRWDFVEAPSQIMENWVWEPEVMKRLAKHEVTGVTLSDEILTKLLAGRIYNVGIKAMRQLSMSMVDLKLHVAYDPNGGTDVITYAREAKSDYSTTPTYPTDATIATFTHIFSGGYGAAYYSYKWAEAIEADFFARFKREGVLNPETGRAYREQVLARGAEVEPHVLIEDFLGRQSTPDAMLIRDGII